MTDASGVFPAPVEEPEENVELGYDTYDGTADSFFSGVVIRVSEDGERFQIGTYYS